MPDSSLQKRKPFQPLAVLGLLGSLWTHYYGGKTPLLTLVRANLALLEQQRQNLAEVEACVSRLTVPFYHTEHWTLIKLAGEYRDGRRFPKPAGLQSMPLLLNRMTDSTVMLQEGIDYQILDQSIEFMADPFENELISQDCDTAYLWGVAGQFDREYVQKHFGYIYRLQREPGQSYEAYRDTINAIADCQVLGTTMARLDALLAAVLGVPVADGREKVLTTAEDRRGRFLVTTRHIYRIDDDAVLAAPEGSKPRVATPLVRSFRISELRPDQLPDGVTDVIVPAGMAGGASKTVPAKSLNVVSCILVQLAKIDYLDDRLADLICRVLPPQTGVVFAAL